MPARVNGSRVIPVRVLNANCNQYASEKIAVCEQICARPRKRIYFVGSPKDRTGIEPAVKLIG